MLGRRFMAAPLLAGAGLALCALTAPDSVEAGQRCFVKTANGTGPTEDVAKFQVYEGLLRSVDAGLWSSWLSGRTTPGYRVGKPVYRCIKGMGLGISCAGRARICKV